MTRLALSNYYPLIMDGWQYKAAFVVLFRPETAVETGRFEGKVEHVASHQSKRFHSLDELLDFIATILAEVRNSETP